MMKRARATRGIVGVALAGALLLGGPVAAQESFTVQQLQQRCMASEVPGVDDAPGICLTVLSLMLFPELDLDTPELGSGGSGSDATVTRSGSGDAQTAPFELSGGDYQIGISGSDAGGEFSAGCVLFNVMHSTDGEVREQGGDLELGPGSSGRDSTFVFGIPRSRYYFDLNTSCDTWTVTIEPA